jgi:hypothetical protein
MRSDQLHTIRAGGIQELLSELLLTNQSRQRLDYLGHN